MAEKSHLEIECHSSSTSRQACYIDKSFSCAVINLNNKDEEEFSYTLKAHRFCFNISGRTKKTEIFHGRHQTFKGADVPEMLTLLPANLERRSILTNTDMGFVRFEICNTHFRKLAESIFGPKGSFSIKPIDNGRNSRLRRLALEMKQRLAAEADPLCFELLAAQFTHTVLTMNGLRAKSQSVWGLDVRALMRVRDYVDAHLRETIRLEPLAAVAGLGPAPFIRAFRTSTGRTPYQFVTQARISRAKEFIDVGDRSLSEIAMAVGYTTPSQFSSAFRSQTGMTPSAYRRASNAG